MKSLIIWDNVQLHTTWLHHAPSIPAVLSLYPWVCQINGSFKSPLHYISPFSQGILYTPQQINHIMKIWINLNKWLHIICVMLKTTTKLYTQSSKLLSLTGMGWVWQMWGDWSHCFITAVSPRSSGREKSPHGDSYEISQAESQVSPSEGVLHQAAVWTDFCGRLVWAKSHKMPQNSGACPSNFRKTIPGWVRLWQHGFRINAWIAGMDKVYTTHTHTLAPNNSVPHRRLIHSQCVSFWGCCQAKVCCLTLWAR